MYSSLLLKDLLALSKHEGYRFKVGALIICYTNILSLTFKHKVTFTDGDFLIPWQQRRWKITCQCRSDQTTEKMDEDKQGNTKICLKKSYKKSKKKKKTKAWQPILKRLIFKAQTVFPAKLSKPQQKNNKKTAFCLCQSDCKTNYWSFPCHSDVSCFRIWMSKKATFSQIPPNNPLTAEDFLRLNPNKTWTEGSS